MRTARNEAGARFPNFHLGARDAKGILVKIVNLTCPGCGARLEVDMDRKMAFCSYCGAALLVDDEIQKVQLDGAEKAGYEFEKGRQRAQAEAAQASFPSRQAFYQPASQPTFQPQVPPQPQQAPQEPPKRRKTWLWVLGWICIFPVPLTIIMLNKEDMSKRLGTASLPQVGFSICSSGLVAVGRSKRRVVALCARASISSGARVSLGRTVRVLESCRFPRIR